MADLVSNEFQQKEWECYKDIPGCCKGYWCAPCLICDNASKLDKGAMGCILSCCFPACAVVLWRMEAREKYGIDGTTLMDVLWGLCCPALVNCQTAHEIEVRKQNGQF